MFTYNFKKGEGNTHKTQLGPVLTGKCNFDTSLRHFWDHTEFIVGAINLLQIRFHFHRHSWGEKVNKSLSELALKKKIKKRSYWRNEHDGYIHKGKKKQKKHKKQKVSRRYIASRYITVLRKNYLKKVILMYDTAIGKGSYQSVCQSGLATVGNTKIEQRNVTT